VRISRAGAHAAKENEEAMARSGTGLAGACATLTLFAAAAPAAAHPHVWVAVETTVLYDAGRVVGLRHRWTFDELYAAMAIQGLDANGDGRYEREELAELAQVNIEGLKEFAYFTQARLGPRELQLAAPTDYWLEYKDNVLSLQFTLPMAEPVLAEAPEFGFTVSDPSYFIAFDLAKENPIRLSEAAPAGCRATIGAETASAEATALVDAFKGATAGLPPDLNRAAIVGAGKTVSVSCPKS
jgi:ABC-type uncharacterized transport system substrate-binding protein